MKRYILDTFSISLSEIEAEKYFFKSLKEMNVAERKKYLRNERKYISFFKKIFERNKKVILQVKNFSNYDVEILLKKERKIYNRCFKNTQKFNFQKNNMTMKSLKELKMFIKLSYRDIYTFQGKYRLYFPKDKIYIYSLTDYHYLILFPETKKNQIEEIIQKEKLYLR